MRTHTGLSRLHRMALRRFTVWASCSGRSCVRLTLATLWALVVAFSLAPVAAADAVKDLIQEFNSSPRVVRADHPLLQLNHVKQAGGSGSYFVSRKLAALARSGRSFAVRSVSRHGDRCELKLESQENQKKTRASLMIVADGMDTAVDVEALLPMVLSDVFDFREPIYAYRYVACKNGLRKLHVASCNHVPAGCDVEGFHSRADAESQGCQPCGICFSVDTYPPTEDYARTRAEATTDAHVHELVYPVVDDSLLQRTVQQLGDSIVFALPFEPRGFEYRFRVIHSEFPTAESYATGFVYISDKLYQSLDSRAELAFTLAHEIAHVEMHFPKPNLPYLAGPYLEYAKESRRRELEADFVAQRCLWELGLSPLEVRGVANVLRKIQFFEQPGPADIKRDKYDTYPSVEERCAWIETPDYLFPSAEGCAAGTEGDVVLNGRLVAARMDSTEDMILIAIETTPAITRTVRLSHVELEVGPNRWSSFYCDPIEVPAEARRLLRFIRRRSMADQRSGNSLAELHDGRIRFATPGLRDCSH